MLFRDWLEIHFKSGKINKDEFEKGVDKLRVKIDKEIKDIDPKFNQAINEEFWNIL